MKVVITLKDFIQVYLVNFFYINQFLFLFTLIFFENFIKLSLRQEIKKIVEEAANSKKCISGEKLVEKLSSF